MFIFPVNMTNHFSLAAFEIFLVFHSLIMICVSVDLFVFILLCIYLSSWIIRIIFFIKIGIYSNYFFQIFFSPLYPFFFLNGNPITQIFVQLFLSYRFLRPYSLSSVFFACFYLDSFCYLFITDCLSAYSNLL